MGNILVIDTETAGLPRDYRASIEDVDNWPRIVQLAFQLYDGYGLMLDEFSSIIKPDGWTISDENAKVHGITNERAMQEGIPILTALERLVVAAAQARYLAAHNIQFDLPIIQCEFVRLGGNSLLGSLDKICTMQIGTKVCKLPGRYGYKWPKLAELHSHLFGSEPEQQHDALADVKSCAKSLFEMRRRGLCLVGSDGNG